ncbi:MAG: hypothetical protein M1824_004871 [Vezdaea acicularis]|nr:MAG: hypothetical protein M1824_004871 [Vezdaea acicularis]
MDIVVASKPYYTAPSNLAPNPSIGLFAASSLQPGNQILSIPQSLLAIPDNEHLNETCAHCFAWKPAVDVGSSVQGLLDGNKRLRFCKKCRTVKYCSTSCSSASWGQAHKYECKVYAKLQGRVLPTTVRAVIQLLGRKEDGAISDNVWNDFIALPSHQDKFRNAAGSTWEDICLMSKGAESYSKTTLGIDLVRDVYCRILINSHTLTTPTLDPLGISLDPLSAIPNHSCTPNAYVLFTNATLTLHPLLPIPKDTEITLSYIDSTDLFHRRHLELKSHYFFTCTCPLCETRSPPIPPSQIPAAEEAYTLVARARKVPGTPEVLEELKNAYGVLHLDMEPTYPLTRQPFPTIVKLLATNRLVLGDPIGTLLRYKALYQAVNPELYPQAWHPVRVVDAWVFAMMLIFVATEDEESRGNPEEQRRRWGDQIWEVLAYVKENVGTSHGDASLFAGVVRRKFEEVWKDMGYPEGSSGGVGLEN